MFAEAVCPSVDISLEHFHQARMPAGVAGARIDRAKGNQAVAMRRRLRQDVIGADRITARLGRHQRQHDRLRDVGRVHPAQQCLGRQLRPGVPHRAQMRVHVDVPARREFSFCSDGRRGRVKKPEVSNPVKAPANRLENLRRVS